MNNTKSRKAYIYTKPEVGDNVVITGMSGCFPDSYNIHHFRDNLFNKVDLVSGDFRRWKPVNPEIPQRTGKLYDIEKFDLGFFGITTSQSYNMDPLMRMLLEKTVEAVLDAGYSPADLQNTRTGVFIGTCFSETERCAYFETLIPSTDSITGTHRSMYADRISYYLKLKGVTSVTDTACSSALYAIEQAYLAIREGLCDKAFVCGTNLCMIPELSLQFARLGVLSKDGASKSFDARANGYVRSEGVVVILLEKAKDAKRIYSELVYAKTNSDGFKPQGITFPSTEAQKTLMREFYKECEIDPAQLTFVEAHGTGTKVGDPEELNSLEKICCAGRNTPLLIGSVKSNIGHTEPASGLCSIVKAIIAMETGFIPPNINFISPTPENEALMKGRMVVVTEKTPLPDQHGLIGINNFGFGGANAHVLLYWNPKAKVNDGQPNDSLPRLLCVSGRTENGIAAILNDFRSRKCDSEYAYIIHQAFGKTIEGYLYRGFGIFDGTGEIKRSVNKIVSDKPELYFVFPTFNGDVLKVAPSLMQIPIFAETIKIIQNVLKEEDNNNILDLITIGSQDGDLINQILGTVAIQISLANVLKKMKLTPNKIMGIGSGELVAAYLADYLTLKQTIIGIFYIACNLVKTNIKNSGEVEKCFTNKKKLFGKWIPANEKKLSENCSKYFSESVTSNNGPNTKKKLPKHVLPLIIGGKTDDLSELATNAIYLLNPHCNAYIVDFLNNLGRLYEYGFDMDLSKLYPSVELPVSRGTPMLSSLIQWNHERDCNVFLYGSDADNKNVCKIVHIDTNTEEWNYINGHTIDGRVIFPGLSYLMLVWQTLAEIKGKMMTDMKIVFNDIRFVRATTIAKGGSVDLQVMIQTGLQKFEVTDANVTVATGRIHEEPPEISNDNVYDILVTDQNLCLNNEDIYKELALRGYHYGGEFKGLLKCNVDGTYGITKWSNSSWVGYMDSALQMLFLQKDIRSLHLPVSICRVVIDARKHMLALGDKDTLPVYSNKEFSITRFGGIEAIGIKTAVIARRKRGNPVLEISKFIPNETVTNCENTIVSFVQMVLENIQIFVVKVVEVCTDNQVENDLLSPMIQKTVDNLPLITADITVLTNENIIIPDVTVKDISSLSTESNCLILIATNILKNIDSVVAVNVVGASNGFIISREDLKTDLSKFSNTPFTVICNHTNDSEMLVLLKLKLNAVDNTHYVDLTNAVDQPDLWIQKLQNILNENNNVVLYAQNEELSGILGLVNCLKREPDGDKISCVFIMDDAPKFDPKLDFYKTQLDKKLAFNIWKDGTWGTYRHLPLSEASQVECQHAYVHVATPGDLSSITWMEGNLNRNDTPGAEMDTVHIYYSALNFRDLMAASGKLPVDVFVKGRILEQGVQGLEFAGRNSKGQRVLGLCAVGALTTIIHSKFHTIIPDNWTMEDAATVSIVYCTVYNAFIAGPKLKPGQSILIHSGTGGIGQAAITLALYFGLNVFVTVGTQEKRDFIKKTYPQIKEEHVGSSRDTSFEDMVYKYTDGKGVDFVLNSLAEEKLIASVRCLAKGGKLVEIGKFDLASNNVLALQLLEKDAHFIGIALDKYFTEKCEIIENSFTEIAKLIKQGVIKPLPRVVFEMNEVEKALRYLGSGSHIGKVLIKIRDEEEQKTCAVPNKLFKASPRFYCKPECSYLICGGLGGVGFELADLLVMKGAKKLVLTSRTGTYTGYHQYRIQMWKLHDVTVVSNTCDASTEEGCQELLNIANELGPVDGIFNLAAVLKDAFFQNLSAEDFNTSFKPKAHSTKNLDIISRKLCPNLRYFVVFSSLSCGRGNAGQTNYGMANSIMERIIEKRKREGYPALAIQWGAIGEVGLVAKMQAAHQELVIGGTIQQGISNCLRVMNNFLTQDEPIVSSMVVAEKRHGVHNDNIFETVLNIMGVTNLKSVSMHATLPELGMDSMTAVEIKQTLERQYQIFLTAQDIRGMTLSKLKDLTSTPQTEDRTAPTATVQTGLLLDIQLMLRNMGSAESANIPLVKLKTLVGDDENAPHIFILPGIEGNFATVETVCTKLKAHVSCLQYVTNKKCNSVEELAESILPYIESVEDLILVGYSYGCLVLSELLPRLEAKGKTAKVIFIDGSPEMVCNMVNTHFPADDELHYQMTLLTAVMMGYFSYDEILNQKETLTKYNTFVEKIGYILDVTSNLNIPKNHNHIIDACSGIYDRLKAANNYKIKTMMIRSNVKLVKAKIAMVVKIAEDYGLSSIFQNKVDIITVEGNHSSIIDNNDLANEINSILSTYG